MSKNTKTTYRAIVPYVTEISSEPIIGAINSIDEDGKCVGTLATKKLAYDTTPQKWTHGFCVIYGRDGIPSKIPMSRSVNFTSFEKK